MNWFAMALGILGAILSARLIVWGFVAWIIANTTWMYLYWGKDWAVVVLFAVYNIISMMGIYEWRKKLKP